MKKHLTQAVSVLALVLLISLVSVTGAFAQTGEKQGFIGEVTAASSTSVTLELKSGETVVIEAPPDPVDLGEGEVQGFAGLPIGSRFAALASKGVSGEWLLEKGRIIPARARQQHRHYTVLKRIGNTLVAKDGDTGVEVIIELEFELDEDLLGEEVTFIGTQVEAGRFRAKGRVALRKIVERLQKHVEKKKRSADQEPEGGAKKRKLRQLEALEKRLEGHVAKQIDRFTEVLVESHDVDRAALDVALEKIKEGFRAALEALGKTAEDVDEALERRVLHAVVAEGGVNLEDSLLTLRTRGDVEVTVSGDVDVLIGDEPGSLADVQDGDHVLVHFDRESGEAASIKVLEIAHAKGRVDRIDKENRTIIIALPDGGSLTLTVVDIERVRINGRPVALAKLLHGTIVRISYNPRTLEPVDIEEQDHSEHTLTIESIDTDARVVIGRTDDGQEVRLELASDARVDSGNHRASVKALRVGARVHAVVDRASDRALSVREEAPGQRHREVVARGSVTAVRKDINALSLRRSDGSEVAVIVDEDAEVLVDGEPARLEDIEGDASLDTTYDPETNVAIKIVAHKRHRVEKLAHVRRTREEDLHRDEEPATGLSAAGTIAKIDLENSQVVVYTEKRRALVFTVNSQSVLSLNGEPIQGLSELSTGAKVKVLFHRTTEGNIVDELHAHKRDLDRDAVRKHVTDKSRLAKLHELSNCLESQLLADR